ncbi:MAG: hypothetical protein J0H01_25135 [Rhizobiales bacterium]|nr:hypothetical protein [Hyphomicrobiales bacterium]
MNSWLLQDIGIDVVIFLFILLLLTIAVALWMQVVGLAGHRAHLQAIEEALRKAAERDETRGRTIATLRGRVVRVEQRVLDALGEPPAAVFWERAIGRAGRRGGP